MKRTSFLPVAFLVCLTGCSPASPSPARSTGPLSSGAELEPRAAPSSPSSAPPSVSAILVAVPGDLTRDPAVVSAVQVVANAEAFGGEQVGYSGEPVPAVVALRALLRDPQAPRLLALVVDRGTLAGKLLALAGLYRADHAAFGLRVAAFRGSKETVKVPRGGCFDVADDVAVGTIVETPGAMQMARPDETLDEWTRRNPGARSLVYDLVGGGYALSLAGS